MNSNIRKLYASNFLAGLVFWYAVEKIFQQSIGLDGFGIAVCVACYLTTTIVFDIPTGLLADRWNRKYTLMLSAAMLGVASMILGNADGLLLYAFGSVAYGLYEVLSSGTYQAIIYDTLHELGRKKEFSKVFGRIYALFLVGIAVGSIIGGFVGSKFGLRMPYYLTLVTVVAHLLLLTSIIEPTLYRKISDKKFIPHAKEAFSKLRGTPVLLQASTLLFAVWIAANVHYDFNHLYLISIGYGAAGLGVLNAGLSLSEAAGSAFAHKLSSKRFALLPALLVILGTVFPLIENKLLVPLLLFLFLIVRGFIENRVETTIQDNVTSDIRATSISIVGFVANLVSVPLILIFGILVRTYGIATAFSLFSAVLAIIVGVIYVRARLASRSLFDEVS